MANDNYWVRIRNTFGGFAKMTVMEAIGAGVEAAGGLASTFFNIKGASAQQDLIKNQMLEERLAATDKQNKLAENARQVLAMQTAQANAQGITDSQSVAAIQSKTFNTYNQDEKNLGLNLQFREDALKAQRDAIRYKEFGNLFSTFSNIGGGIGSLATSLGK